MKITIEPTRDFTIRNAGTLKGGTRIEAELHGDVLVSFTWKDQKVTLMNNARETEWKEVRAPLTPSPPHSLTCLLLLCALCALNCPAATQVIVKDQGVAQITWNGTNPPGLWVQDYNTPAAVGDTNPIAAPSIYHQPGLRPFVILWWTPNSFSYAIESSLNLRDWLALITISNRPSPFEIRGLVTGVSTNLEREYFRLRRLDLGITNGVAQASKPAVSQVSQPASPTQTPNQP